jgi:uncharacterized membrane protein YeiB
MIPSPIPQKDRTVIVDVVRGFALVGVLVANFTSYVDQQTPESILDSISSPLDLTLMHVNSVFFEWKFMDIGFQSFLDMDLVLSCKVSWKKI